MFGTPRLRFMMIGMVICVVLASGWILYSDNLLGELLDPALMGRVAMVEGLALVAITSAGLGILVVLAPDGAESTVQPDEAVQAPPPKGGETRLSAYLVRLVLICVLPLLLLAAGLGIADIRGRQDENDRLAVRLARDMAADIDRDLSSRIGGLGMLAASSDLDDRKSWPQFYAQAQAFRDSFGSHVVVADAGNPMRTLMNTREPLGAALGTLPRPRGHAAAPAALATGKPAVGDTFLGPVANKTLVAVAVPVVRGGRVGHIILTTLGIDRFQRRLDQVTLPRGWSLGVLDGRGAAIAQLGRLDQQGDEGVNRFVAHSTLSQWSVVVRIPESARRAPIVVAISILALALLLAGGASVFGGALAARNLARQVAGLSREGGGEAPTIREIAGARRRLDEAARLAAENRERFRRLFANVPLALAFIAEDGRIVARNTQFDLLFGYDSEELATLEDWWRLAYPDAIYRAQAMEEWAEAVTRSARERGEAGPVESWITGRDGRERLVQVSGIVLPDGVLTSFLDITERRRAEDVLRESEVKYRLLAENSPDCIVWTAPDHRIHYMSAAGQRIFGRPAESFLGDPTLMPRIIHRADLADYTRHLSPECAGHAEELEFRVIFPDGGEHWVAHRCWPVHDADGRYLGRHAINRDITGRKHHDEVRHHLSTALLEAGLPILMLDAERRVEFVNQAFLTLTGYGAAELIGEPLARIVPDDEASRRQQETLFQVLEEKGAWSGELTRLARDGSLLPLFTSVTALRGLDGRLTGYVVGYIDLRPLREHQDALYQSEGRLHLFIDHAPAALAMFDRGMRYLAVSRRWRDDYQLGELPILGRCHYEVFPEIGEDWKAIHRRALDGETVSSDQDRFERADGSVQWLRWEVRPWHSARGEIGGIVVFSEDITRLKEQAEELEAGRARTQSILDHAADAVFIVDSAGRYLYANHRAGQLLGYTADEILGLSIPDITPPEDAAHSATTFQELQRDGHLATELLLARKDGSRVPVEINAIMLPDGTAYGACRDITERRRAEKRLRDLSQAIEQTPLSVLVTDLDSRIDYVNGAFTELTGFGRDEVMGRDPRLLASGKTPPETYASLWRALAEGRSWKGEFLNRRKDGEEYVEFAIIAPVRNGAGEPAGYVAIQEDITEKKRMGDELARHRRNLEGLVEEKQRNANALQSLVDRLTVANGELERIAMVAAHDLREPARAVTMYAQLLERRIAGRLERDELEYLRYLATGARRIYDLIGGLLDFSHIPAAGVAPGPVSAAKAYALALESLGASVLATGAAVQSSNLPEVMADEGALLQVFQNLLGNALKFRHPDRSLRIAVEAERRGALWLFRVSDNGIGMEAGGQDVFDLFRQLAPGRKAGGIGAGLAICKRIVQRLGGEIWAESEPGRGSTFLFTLPAVGE